MGVMPNKVRVVFMRRDVREITASHNSFLPARLKLEHLDDSMDVAIEQLRNRKDVEGLRVFQYQLVLKEPEIHFYILRDDGWPIDPKKAAEIVDPDMCHFKETG